LEVEIPPPVGDAANFVVEDGVVTLIVILTSPKPNSDIEQFEQLHDAVLLCFRYFSTSADFVKVLI